MATVELPTYKVTFKDPGIRADHALIGTPISVTVPSRHGGKNTATGVISEIGGGFIVVEFIKDE